MSSAIGVTQDWSSNEKVITQIASEIVSHYYLLSLGRSPESALKILGTIWIAFSEYHLEQIPPLDYEFPFRAFWGDLFPSPVLGKSALEVLKVFSKLSNLKL